MGVTIELVRIPAGQFVMGAADGKVDERPRRRVSFEEPFWMSTCEVTNAQFRRFDPTHCSGLYSKRYEDGDGPSLSLDRAGQPVVRVSWEKARDFCRWLSRRTGLRIRLPTEARWEYTCRGGSASPLWFGNTESDFSRFANAADATLSHRQPKTGGLSTNIVDLRGGGLPYHGDVKDGHKVTARVGSFRANPWGLHDMHGNAAEWTRTTYRAYPYRPGDGRNANSHRGRKVVRGGSFRDTLERCRSAFRLRYPTWQRVFNVGFRIAWVPSRPRKR